MAGIATEDLWLLRELVPGKKTWRVSPGKLAEQFCRVRVFSLFLPQTNGLGILKGLICKAELL